MYMCWFANGSELFEVHGSEYLIIQKDHKGFTEEHKFECRKLYFLRFCKSNNPLPSVFYLNRSANSGFSCIMRLLPG
jgi:hypothetical protein